MKKISILLLMVCGLFACDDDSNDRAMCTTPAIIKDLTGSNPTGFDACRFVFLLEDGTRLQPIRPFLFCGTPPLPKEITDDPLYNYEFIDGKKVLISYSNTTNVSICMVGPIVKIDCITDARTTSSEE